MNALTLKTTHMHKMKKRVKYVMDDLSSFDLDTMWEWQIAEMMARGNNESKQFIMSVVKYIINQKTSIKEALVALDGNTHDWQTLLSQMMRNVWRAR